MLKCGACGAMVPITCLAGWRLADDDFLATFKLPDPNERCDALRMRNPMPREDRIVFYEEAHTYRADGIRAPRSVTGLMHEYQCGSFDPVVGVKATKRGKNRQTKKDEFVTDCGRDVTNEEICESWLHNGKVASAKGTLLHYQS